MILSTVSWFNHYCCLDSVDVISICWIFSNCWWNGVLLCLLHGDPLVSKIKLILKLTYHSAWFAKARLRAVRFLSIIYFSSVEDQGHVLLVAAIFTYGSFFHIFFQLRHIRHVSILGVKEEAWCEEAFIGSLRHLNIHGIHLTISSLSWTAYTPSYTK